MDSSTLPSYYRSKNDTSNLFKVNGTAKSHHQQNYNNDRDKHQQQTNIESFKDVDSEMFQNATSTSNGLRLDDLPDSPVDATDEEHQHLNSNGSATHTDRRQKAQTANHTHKQKRDKFCSFELFYKNLDSVNLGDVLHGWMEVNLCRPTTIIRMTVTFYGELVTSRRDRRGTRTTQFESQTQELWHEPNRTPTGARLEPGFYVYEFFVGTRLDLPSAFVSKTRSGVIHSLLYYCEVRINELFDDGEITSHIKRKSVLLRTSPHVAPLMLEKLDTKPVVERGGMFVRNLMDMSGCVVCTVTLANHQCRPGDNLLFNVQVLNCFRHLKVHASIEQLAKIADDATGTFESLRHVFYAVKLGALTSTDQSKQWLGQTLWVPDHKLVNVHVSQMYRSRTVFLGYQLVVSVHPRIGKSLDVRVPLVVRDSIVVTGHQFGNGTMQSGAATL